MKKVCFIVLLCFFSISIAFGQYHGASGRMEELDFFIFNPDSPDTFENGEVSLELLDRMAPVLSSRGLTPGQIHVFGYSAIAGNEVNPTLLAYNRAIFIITELVKRGVPWDLFAPPMGYGAVSVWGVPQQYNRRVTVNIAETASYNNPESRPGTAGTAAAAAAASPSGNQESLIEIENERFENLVERLETLEKFEAENKRVITGWFVGVGPEINGNSDRISFAVGGYISGGIEFMYHYVLGLRIGYFTDRFSNRIAEYNSKYKSDPDFYSDVNTFEAVLLFRYYLPFNGIFSGVFVEGNVGMSSFSRMNLDTNNREARPAPHGGVAAGWRFTFFKHWYVEPLVRFGFPFTWGAGFMTGLKF